MADEDVDITVQLKRVAEFQRDSKRAANSIDNIGDQAAQAARRMKMLSAASSKTRVNFGPFSTSLRGGALAVGGLAIATRKLTPEILSAAEAVATLTGGAAAAGGVGILALAQGAGVARLGLSDLTDALGGSEEAAKRLTPEVRDLFNELRDAQTSLRTTAQEGMLPGLEQGTRSAMRNLPVLNRIVSRTARMLGRLGSDAGGMLGSDEWGRDLERIGTTNVRIFDDLGHAGLDLADAARHVAVEAGPLTEWLADSARDGARFVEVWAESARASGEMADFFERAREQMELLGSAGGHGGRGIINLFGNHDVDGTRTLENLDRIMARFERWTTSPAVREDIGQAIVDEFVDLGGEAAGALATGMANAAPTAAGMFVDAFMEADAWGKLLIGGWLAKKLGGFKLLGQMMGRQGGGGALGAVSGRGTSPANPIFVADVTSGFPGAAPNSKLGRVQRLIRGAGTATAVGAVGAAATEGTSQINKLLGIDVPGPDIGLSPLQIPATAQRIAEAIKGGDDPKPRHRAEPAIIENNLTLTIDGVPFARIQGNTEARRRARQSHGGPAVP